MGRKGKRQCCAALLIWTIVTGCCMSGCAGEYTGDGKNAASGASVSGAAVSGQEQAAPKGTYCSDTNIYIQAWQVDEQQTDSEYVIYVPALVQTRPDGSGRKMIDMGENFAALAGVAGQWLYYATHNNTLGENDVCIWRIPIEKGADGYDEIDTSRKEKIIEDALDVDQILVDDNYLIYTRPNEVVVYDLQKKEEIDIKTDENMAAFNMVEEVWRMGGQYVVYAMEELLAVSPPGETEWRSVIGDGYLISDESTHNEQFMFYECFPIEEDECEYKPKADYMERDAIRVNDGREDRSFITRKELKEAVEDAVRGLGKFTVEECDEWLVVNMLCEDNLCLIEVMVTGTHDGIYYMGNVILSKREGSSEIRYEKGLTEYVWEREKKWHGKWYVKKKKEEKVIKENSIVNPVCCRNIKDGRVYFYFHDEESKRKLAYYELDSGQCGQITSQDALYYASFCDEKFKVYMSELEGEWGDGFRYELVNEIMDLPILPNNDARFKQMRDGEN